MGTKLKKKHHHAHWTLILDKLHTPEYSELSAHFKKRVLEHTQKARDEKMVCLSEHNPSGCATKERRSAVVYLCLLAALETGI